MAYTQTQIDNLKALLAKGVLEAGHGANRVKYRSRAEMAAQIAAMEAEVNPASVDDRRALVTQFDRGL